MILEHEVLTTVPVAMEMKGVLFSLHGCLQLTKEWGFPSETCPECSGRTSSSMASHSHKWNLHLNTSTQCYWFPPCSEKSTTKDGPRNGQSIKELHAAKQGCQRRW